MDATASDSSSVSSSELMAPYPPKVTVSGTDIRAKEVILVLMALCLLVCSICLFFKHWKKNYRDINQVSILWLEPRRSVRSSELASMLKWIFRLKVIGNGLIQIVTAVFACHPAQAAESRVESAMTLHSWLYIWAFSSGHQNKEEKFDTKADL